MYNCLYLEISFRLDSSLHRHGSQSSYSFKVLDLFDEVHSKLGTIKMFLFPIELNAVGGALFFF